MRRRRPLSPRTPSKTLLAAALRPGAGSHGGSAKTKNRRDRRGVKLSLRKDYP